MRTRRAVPGLIAWLVLACFAGPPATAGTSRPADAGSASTGVQWRSWDDGLREADRSKRPVLVDVYTDWCGWCRRMDRDVYGRSDVRKYLSSRFVTVKLNAESSASGRYQGRSLSSRSLAQHFGVRGYPTTVFLRPGGDHITNVGGYVPADRFLLILRYIGDGHLDRGTPFEEFEKQADVDRPGPR